MAKIENLIKRFSDVLFDTTEEVKRIDEYTSPEDAAFRRDAFESYDIIVSALKYYEEHVLKNRMN